MPLLEAAPIPEGKVSPQRGTWNEFLGALEIFISDYAVASDPRSLLLNAVTMSDGSVIWDTNGLAHRHLYNEDEFTNGLILATIQIKELVGCNLSLFIFSATIDAEPVIAAHREITQVVEFKPYLKNLMKVDSEDLYDYVCI